jgi:hypothetical protein
MQDMGAEAGEKRRENDAGMEAMTEAEGGGGEDGLGVELARESVEISPAPASDASLDASAQRRRS